MKITSATKRILSNCFLFVLALALAILLWLLAMRQLMPAYTVSYSDIPVDVLGPTSGLSLTSETSTVTASFSATKTELYRYRQEGILSLAELESPSVGTYEVTLRFFCAGVEIIPETPVKVKVTVSESYE